MKALVKFAPGAGNVELREVEEPVIKDLELLVKIKAAGFCGTDMEILTGDFKTAIPVTLGHEGAGEVVKVGKAITEVKVGDRVAMETTRNNCRSCYFCRIGRYNLCASRTGSGYGTNGVFAEYAKTEEGKIHKMADNMSYEQAAILEPLSVSTRAVIEISNTKAGDSVLISGVGPIGLFTLQVVKAAGAKNIIMVGRTNQIRLDLARKLGATHLLKSGEVDVVSQTQDITGGLGVDRFFECSGNPQAFLDFLPAVRKAGEVIPVGIYPKTIQLDLNYIVMNELEVKGTWTSGVFTDWTRAIALVESGQVKLDPLISHRFPLTEWRKIVEVMEERTCIKGVFIFD